LSAEEDPFKYAITGRLISNLAKTIQAAFTIKEAREIIQIPDCAFAPVSREFFPDDLKTLARPRRRIAELLIKSSISELQPSRSGKLCAFDFLLSPTAFLKGPRSPSANQLGSMSFQKNQFSDHDNRFEPTANIIPTPNGDPVSLPASVAFRSIGYKSEPLPGSADIGVPFDHRRGIIPNRNGRVLSSALEADRPTHVQGMYVAGWAKRGPTGVIASTMDDAFDTADSMVRDIRDEDSLPYKSTGRGWDAVKELAEKKGLRRVSWADWRRIDEAERWGGGEMGKEREKITSIVDMLTLLDR
jgi:adrenodoxin-NADP+ reductase